MPDSLLKADVGAACPLCFDDLGTNVPKDSKLDTALVDQGRSKFDTKKEVANKKPKPHVTDESEKFSEIMFGPSTTTAINYGIAIIEAGKGYRSTWGQDTGHSRLYRPESLQSCMTPKG